jgi:hypothetical protein
MKNRKKHRNNYSEGEKWVCTVCKRCLTDLRGLKDENGNIYIFECLHCGESYVPHEITYAEKQV